MAGSFWQQNPTCAGREPVLEFRGWEKKVHPIPCDMGWLQGLRKLRGRRRTASTFRLQLLTSHLSLEGNPRIKLQTLSLSSSWVSNQPCNKAPTQQRVSCSLESKHTRWMSCLQLKTRRLGQIPASNNHTQSPPSSMSSRRCNSRIVLPDQAEGWWRFGRRQSGESTLGVLPLLQLHTLKDSALQAFSPKTFSHRLTFSKSPSIELLLYSNVQIAALPPNL